MWFWLRGGLGSDTRACACSLNPFYLNPFYVNPFYGAGFRPESPSGSFATAEPAMPGAPLQQSLEAALSQSPIRLTPQDAPTTAQTLSDRGELLDGVAERLGALRGMLEPRLLFADPLQTLRLQLVIGDDRAEVLLHHVERLENGALF